MVKINRVYTGTGDDGTSAFVDGSRHSKSHDRFDIVGSCDELNSVIGIVRTLCRKLPNHSDGGSSVSVKRIQSVSEKALGRIQSELFDLGAEMACELDKLPDYLNLISTKQCDDLTEEMDAWLEHLEPLTSFIMPTGNGPESYIHLARTITRRLERNMVRLKDKQGNDVIRREAFVYINRLSDWLFVFSRWVTKNLGGDEELWIPLAKRDEVGNVANLIKKINQNDGDFAELN